MTPKPPQPKDSQQFKQKETFAPKILENGIPSKVLGDVSGSADKEEFVLDNEIIDLTGFGTGYASPRFIHVDSVKKFIEIILDYSTDITKSVSKKELYHFITNLAGEKLL